MLETFRNNLLWMVLGTSLSVGFGLLIAVLADRSRYESLYKSIIFMPMAISFVGAGVIWKFIYTYKGEGVGIQEIGLLTPSCWRWAGSPSPGSTSALEQFFPDHHHGLAANGLRHGHFVIRHQGHSLRTAGSGSH
jgi:ABC-type sugar transport system permease subunit